MAVVSAAFACSKNEPVAAAPVVARLDLFGGGSIISMGFDQVVRLDPVLVSLAGDNLEMPPGFTLVSRDSSKVSVENGTWIHSRAATPSTRVVGTVLYHGTLLGDSLSVTVSCPAVLIPIVTPSSISIAIGETSVVPVVSLRGGCGETLSDTFTWTVADPTIVSVNAATGAVTGLSVGNTLLTAHGVRYGNFSIGVTVH
jgi:hypothetical protein